MKINDILNIANAKLLYGNPNSTLELFSIDTRSINHNDTYVAIIGEVYDGNNFYLDALEKGAKTCILSNFNENNFDKNKYNDRNIILVNDTVLFLTELAKFKRKKLNMPIIAVTGSVGKTSTKNIIADVLSSKYKIFKTSGNLNSKIGLSLMLLNITNEDIAVLEMGMNQKGEISTLTNICKPTIGVITNIGTAHIGNLGSRENILKAKLEILEGLDGPIIINNDNDLLHDWYKKEKNNYDIITYGINNKSNYNATNISYNKNGSNFNINNLNIDIPVIGKHFIYNSIVAYLIGKHFNIDDNLIIKKLKKLTLEPDRMELINKNNILIINDTYNSSYDSVYYALEVLSSFKARKIAVLGDILELGDYAKELHSNIGALIDNKNIDILITVGNNAKYINDNCKLNKENNINFNNNEEAIKYINNILKANDAILIKASHGMNFKEIVNGIINNKLN